MNSDIWQEIPDPDDILGHADRMNETPKYTPAVVARLYDGVQLIRERPLLDGAPEVIQTMEEPPPRLQALESQFDKDRPIGFSIWERVAWGSSSIIDLHEWHMMVPNSPPKGSLVEMKDRPPMVAIRYVDYQRTGSRVG